MKIRRPHSRRHRSRGFTLLEMVIVLGIIAMILGGGIYFMTGISDSAKLSQVDADFKSLDSALSAYRLNAGNLPSTQQGLGALVEKPTTTPVPRRWNKIMTRVPKDPWQNDYIYRFPGKKNAATYEILSKGPDGIENTADDLSSQDD